MELRRPCRGGTYRWLNPGACAVDTDYGGSRMVGFIAHRRIRRPVDQASVSLGRGQGGSPHERRVTQIALRLFDLLSPLHQLNDSYREILRVASLLHDAGRCFGAADHHITGAQMVADTLEGSAWKRRCVAYLVRYHRGQVPPVATSEFLLAGDGRKKIKTLLGMLRAADGLDSRRVSADAIIAKRRGRKLRISCLVNNKIDDARACFQRRRKFKLLAKMVKLRVMVRVEQAA
jgi:hypothetical protein